MQSQRPLLLTIRIRTHRRENTSRRKVYELYKVREHSRGPADPSSPASSSPARRCGCRMTDRRSDWPTGRPFAGCGRWRGRWRWWRTWLSFASFHLKSGEIKTSMVSSLWQWLWSYMYTVNLKKRDDCSYFVLLLELLPYSFKAMGSFI